VVADVAIVGAGPAGAALAIELGRRGVRVNLYEKARVPRLKPCGEGILPHGVAALRAIAGELPGAPRVGGLRFVVDDTAVEAPFPDGHGLVVRRDRLHAWLLSQAGKTTGVDVRPGCHYTPSGERFIVGADGLHSQFHRRLPARRPVMRRVGMSTHLAGVEGLGDRVEVFFHPVGEVYLAPSGDGEALVAALVYQRTFRRDALTFLLRDIPELRARTAHAEMTTPLLASAPLGLHVPRVVDRNLLLIGDAAGAPDPITGDGMAMAFASVKPAADAIVSGDLAAYDRVRLATGKRSERLGRLLLRLARFQGRAAKTLMTRPALVPTLLDVAIARRPLNTTTLLRAVLG
jgi:flavin-dependent dehydrogenase